MIPAPFVTPFAVVLLVVGLVACFAGYRAFRAVLTMFGFVIGALLGSSLVAASDTLAMIVAAVLGGIIGAVALNLGYFVGVALLGAALGVLLLHSVWRLAASGDPHVAMVIVAAVVGAVGAAQLQRVVIVVATAFAGAWTLLFGGLALAGDRVARAAAAANDVWVAYPLHPGPGRDWVLWAWLAVGALGAAVQFRGKARGSRKTVPRRARARA